MSLSSTAARGALAAGALFVTAYLCYFSVRTARAEYYTRQDTLYGYERATQIEPEDAQNWYLLGRHLQYSLEDQDPQRAINSYLKSLEIDPHSTTTWLDLASLYESEGSLADARRAFLRAQKSYPLSAEVSWRYGNFLLRQGELEPAFVEIRHAVEADPYRAAEAFSRCARVEPDVDVILDRVVPSDRNVYRAIIQDLVGDEVPNALKVWKRLAAIASQTGPHRCFHAGCVASPERLPAGGSGDLAAIRGIRRDDTLCRIPDSAMWDGGFESDAIGQGYTWRFSKASHGVQISFDSRKNTPGNALCGFLSTAIPTSFSGVCQTCRSREAQRYEVSGLDADEGADDGQGSDG